MAFLHDKEIKIVCDSLKHLHPRIPRRSKNRMNSIFFSSSLEKLSSVMS